MAHGRWGLCQRFCIGAQEFQVMRLPTTVKSSASLVSSTVIHILYFCSDVFDYIQCLWYIISRQPYVHSLPKARSHSWCHPLWIITVIHQFQHTLLFVSITYSTYGCMIMYQDVYLQPSRWSQAFAAARYPPHINAWEFEVLWMVLHNTLLWQWSHLYALCECTTNTSRTFF